MNIKNLYQSNKERIKNLTLKDVYRFGKEHIVDATALALSTNPIFAFSENVMWGMTDEESFKARALMSLIGYLGLATIYSRARDFSRKHFSIDDKTKEGIQWIHDTSYAMAFNAFFAPAVYMATTEADLGQLIGATITAMAFAPITGYVGGYAMDGYRDLTGIQDSQRVNRKIRNLSPKLKLGVAALVTVGLIGVHAGIYKLTPDNEDVPIEIRENIETIVDQDYS